MNLSPLNTVVSWKVILFSDNSAVINLIVGWNLLAWSIKCSTFLSVVSILLAWYRFVGLIHVSIFAMKTLAKDTAAIFRSHSGSMCLEKVLPIELKRIFVKD